MQQNKPPLLGSFILCLKLDFCYSCLSIVSSNTEPRATKVDGAHNHQGVVKKISGIIEG